jgi:hypothetical protein
MRFLLSASSSGTVIRTRANMSTCSSGRCGALCVYESRGCPAGQRLSEREATFSQSSTLPMTCHIQRAEKAENVLLAIHSPDVLNRSRLVRLFHLMIPIRPERKLFPRHISIGRKETIASCVRFVTNSYVVSPGNEKRRRSRRTYAHTSAGSLSGDLRNRLRLYGRDVVRSHCFRVTSWRLTSPRSASSVAACLTIRSASSIGRPEKFTRKSHQMTGKTFRCVHIARQMRFAFRF